MVILLPRCAWRVVVLSMHFILENNLSSASCGCCMQLAFKHRDAKVFMLTKFFLLDSVTNNNIKKSTMCLNKHSLFLLCITSTGVGHINTSSVQILFCRHEARARLEVSRASIINENKWLGCCVLIDVELLDV